MNDSRDDRDPPIVNPGFMGGVNVVDIGDVRVARGLSRRHRSSCPHRRMAYDTQERRIWCEDCEHNVEAFDAFTILVENFDRQRQRLDARAKQVAEAESHKLRSLAAKNIDKAWQHRDMVPACPHCFQGLFPEDFKHGIGLTLGRDYALAMAAKRKGEKT